MGRAAQFSVLPLGGLGEIGMNCLAVETEGRLLIIDCGVMFGNDDAGIDLIHPGFEYLASRRSDIEGVVITHGHEDHLSGLPFLLREIDVPIYAGSYAIQLLKSRLSESPINLQPMMRTAAPDETLHLGPFRVTPFSLPHSIVQNTGLLVEMNRGRLLHTGDFKLGLQSEGRENVALDTLKRVARNGIDLMLCDSTGAEEADIAGSETQVFETLKGLFQETNTRIFAAVFSSNIRRIESILNLSKQYGRKVVLCGRSVQNHFRCVGAACGIHAPTDIIVSLEEAMELPRNELTVIISGTQGESRSALSRTAAGNHHALSAEPDDLVVLSSRFIPGNELSISRMIDRLLMQGARVIHRGLIPGVHVSGHGGKIEIRKAIEAVSPRCFLPIHGTYRHLSAGAALAQSTGCENISLSVNGQVVSCDETGLSVEGGFPTRRVFVDRGGSLSDTVVKDRRILGGNGVVSVAFTLNERGESDGPVDVISKGVVPSELTSWFRKIVAERVLALVSGFESNDRDSTEALKEAVRVGVRKFLNKQISREPLVVVSILGNSGAVE